MFIALHPATESDHPAIVALMNAAFRGEEGQRGWSTEAGYMTGVRASESHLREEIAKGALNLLTRDETTSALEGCVSMKASTPEKGISAP